MHTLFHIPQPTKENIRALREENKRYTDQFVQLPQDRYSRLKPNAGVVWVACWRNRYFLVQIFEEKNATRITVNRTDIDKQGRWKEGITWDELQAIKDHVGYAQQTAIEIYPPADKVVNVSNMRHLWLIKDQSVLPVW